ncbi:carbohydrate ABC transporter permease [Pseudonocardia lacus]|uniref:carbohydrate ABC transporter permease n=1 Tax=Pseudonocardia lacus TaxID=2835865 RepID=UPI0027E22585|nr:sugar ABC transporter permease [Pseudonocardia lacus]
MTTTSPRQVAVPPVGDRPQRRSPTGRSSARRRGEIALFLGPALLLYATFVIVPMVLAGYYSLFNWNGLGPLDQFIGIDNYTRAAGDPVFRAAVGHNALIVVLSVVVQLPLALALALLLNRRLRGRAILRMVLFAPYVLAEVVTAVAWQLILQPSGPLNTLLENMGLESWAQLWLADRDLVIYSLFIVITWKYLGFGIVLFLAGLQGVPNELLEAATVDGASAWHRTRYVVLPLLGPTIRIWIFLSVIGALQLFDLVWIMTKGGPSNASVTMATFLIDRGFERSQIGYGSAAAVLLFIISFVFALLYQRYVMRRDTEGALTRRVG